MVGICSFGGYVPRYRLNRMLIFEAMGWLNTSTIAYARGEKAVANFDEDSITMAVAAGLDCLRGLDRSLIEGVYFASTSMPFKERLNAGIITAALGLDEHTRAADFSGGLKSSTTALLAALEGVEAGRMKNALACTADCRLGKPASPQEMIFGDAAAAFLVGNQDVLAEFKGSFSTTYDFVDHFRGQFAKFDRQWEDRWIRDLGFEFIIPDTLKGLLEKYSLQISDFSKVIYPCHYGAERKKLNKVLGIAPEMDQNNLLTEVGDSGAAQSLVMLAHALEEGKPGDKIIVLGFGSGCDALYFELTENITKPRAHKGVSGYLADKAELDKYGKYLVWRDILPAELGPRSEEDVWTRWSFNWRKRKAILGLWGSKCTNCGTIHFPPQRICVNPECGKVDEMEDFLLSDKAAEILNYTGDNLAASNDPPATYGTIRFATGGRFQFDFTDCDLDSLAVGMAMDMSFRRRSYDPKRDISGYFWKAVPKKEVK
ncbi:MAG: zinc ribbon domain-containing protein [Thermodesulfobacteriota bacterium]|nr:zinc ribbon domain-containing protein [Thermodesulfobacteriota bacterium]